MLRKAAVLAVLAVVAGCCALVPAADAHAARHRHHSSAHDRRVRRMLLRELKRHPRVILRRSFARKADSVNLRLPLTVRLNPNLGGSTEAASDDVLTLDLGTDPFADPAGSLAGAVQVVLHGKFGMLGRFDIDTSGTGVLGALRLDAGAVQMSADPFPIVEPASACTDSGPLLQSGPSTIVTAPPLPASDKRGGMLNWFTGDFSMRLYTQFDLNSQRRATCGDPFFWTNAITSTTNSVIPIDMVGQFHISPTLTSDGRLRLFTLSFDNAVTAQKALPAILHTCTQATATLATDPAPTAACDGVSGDEAQIPMTVQVTHLTGEVLVGDA